MVSLDSSNPESLLHSAGLYSQPELLWPHLVSEGIIVLSCIIVACGLFYIASRRNDMPLFRLFPLLGVLIGAFGFFSVMHIIMLWHPVGIMQYIINIGAAITILTTSAMLVYFLPKLVYIPATRSRVEVNIEFPHSSTHQEAEGSHADLLKLLDKLTRSNKELDEFAHIASHDLREPLRGIHNHAHFLLEDNEDKLDTESVRRINRLIYLSQRMEKLVSDLLYFSRLGRQELAIQLTDMNAVVLDIQETLDVFLADNQARILIPNPLPEVVCDKTRITEAFRNLITNAVKYNHNPEKIVEIGYSSTKTLLGEEAGDTLVFFVSDNGMGIAPECKEEIFRIFKRLHYSDQAAQEGTGAGLTFVKKIVERHGGHIWLESEPGKGSVFYFTLGNISYEGYAYDEQSAA